jgi:hypothetical protein
MNNNFIVISLSLILLLYYVIGVILFQKAVVPEKIL